MARILIVEDSPTQAERLRATLEAEGHEARVTESAEAAIEALSGADFEMVISDIVMPGQSGYDLCRHLKAAPAWRAIPVILLTTLGDPMDIIQGLECGADNFLTKPYEPEHLLARIQSIFENRRLRSEGRFRVGVEIAFLGKRFTINSDRQQILDLLISTFEDIVHTNQKLEKNRRELALAKAQIEQYAHQLEGRARTSEERYRQLFEIANDAILVLDVERQEIIDANRAAETLLGCPITRLIGLKWEQLFPETERLRNGLWLREWTLSGAGLTEGLMLRLDGGGAVHIEISVGALELGGRRSLLAFIRDATKRKQAEAALQESEQRARGVLNHVFDGIVTTDEAGTIESFSPSAERILGYTEEEMVGENFARFLPVTGDGGQGATARGLELPDLIGVTPKEVMARRKDGTTVSVEIAIGDSQRGDGRVLIASLRDVSDRKQIEAQLQQAMKMEAIGQLTGGVAHDFNNILSVVLGNLQLLERTVGNDDRARKRVESAIGATLRGAELTTRLLGFSRRQVLEPRLIDVNGLVSGLDSMLRRTLGEMIEIRTVLGESLWLANVDPGQLENAVLNLAINARDAMPGGGRLTIETSNIVLDEHYAARHVEVSAGEYIRLAVSDSGTGMTGEVMERAFDPFFTTKEVGKGTGLGLSMVYGFVKQSGGHVKLYSEPGHGTTVRMYLPRAAAGAPDHAAADRADQPATGTEYIMVVEDDADVRDVAVALLEELGYRVSSAADGPSALEHLRSVTSAPDLLLTDVMMPGGMTGFELATEARRLFPEMKVLYASGYTENAVAHRGALEGGRKLISKPYLREELARTVRDVLDG